MILLLPERNHLDASPIADWLRRGDLLRTEQAGDDAVLRQVFELAAGPLPVAALTRQLDVGDAGEAVWLRADPAWLRADMMTARLFAHGDLGLSAAEIDALLPDLQALFAEHDLLFDAPTPTRWYLRCPTDLDLPLGADPDAALGDDLKLHLPIGPAGKRWRVLSNDIQILLHNHVVNQRRAARGAVTVNGLWLWGAGRWSETIRSEASLVCTDDPLLRSMALAAGVTSQPLGDLSALPSIANDRKATWVLDLRRLRGDDLLQAVQTVRQQVPTSNLAMYLRSGERISYRRIHRWRFWR